MAQKWWPSLFVFVYFCVFGYFGLFNAENFAIGSALLLLSIAGKGPRKVFNILFPVALTYIIYQTQVLYADFLRARIRVDEPYYLDLFFFGVETSAGKITLPQWWQYHTHPILDFICGLAYLTYFLNFVLIGVFFYFVKGRSPESGSRFKRAALLMMWAFFFANMLGYSTYYWYPAAPPWYVDIYGLGPANILAAPDPAGAIRFDELLGISIFQGFYSKSANVFGAIPSLHIVYPLIAAYFAVRLRSLVWVAILNFVIVCFAAVYLNHHYVIDIIWGAVYAFVVCGILDYFFLAQSKKKEPDQTKAGLDEVEAQSA